MTFNYYPLSGSDRDTVRARRVARRRFTSTAATAATMVGVILAAVATVTLSLSSTVRPVQCQALDNVSKLTATDGAEGDSFGYSVAISDSGDLAVIGAVGDDNSQGSVYIFLRNPSSGLWSETQVLTANDGTDQDNFGCSVAISGDTAVIGAFGDDDNDANSGSAYIFSRNPSSGVFSQTQKLTAYDGATQDFFGVSVSIFGDVAMVGSPFDDDSGSRSGSAYIFSRNPSSGVWSQTQKLTANDAATDDRFGQSVAISGDSAVAGAYADDDEGSSTGSAYIFSRNPSSGLWAQTQKLTANDATAGARFGRTVAISGNSVVIGATGDDEQGSTTGAAYVFSHNLSSSVWLQTQKLTANDAAAEDAFGTSVSISGDSIVISAIYNDDIGTNSGSAYIFSRNPSSGVWLQAQKLTANDGADNDNFGRSVAVSGDSVVIGAWPDDDNGDNSGSAYIFSASTEPGPEPGECKCEHYVVTDSCTSAAVSTQGDNTCVCMSFDSAAASCDPQEPESVEDCAIINDI
jgi:FG-GAP repeat